MYQKRATRVSEASSVNCAGTRERHEEEGLKLVVEEEREEEAGTKPSQKGQGRRNEWVIGGRVRVVEVVEKRME